MMSMRAVVLATTVLLTAAPVLAANLPTDRERLRAQAEHDCYDDVQKLCNDAIPDETKITACMQAKRASLSPACGKVFDRGLD